ncbi:iron chelate uptake ABC transporter family permease subunit [bacterium]|nr:iron chelate uptake ABC transporter family permease subunit [bacterium]
MTEPGVSGVEVRADWFEERARKERLCLVVLVLLLAVTMAFAVANGAVSISIRQVGAILLRQAGVETGVEYTRAQEAVLLSIRLPRVILGTLVGATLAMCGAAIQGLFRNPLAEPGLIGTAGGGAMAAVIAIVSADAIFGKSLPYLLDWIVPIAAFLGSLAVTWLIYHLSRSMGRVQVTTMLLAGIAINAMAFAVVGLAMFLASDSQLRTITFWSLGSVAGANWKGLIVAAPLMIVALAGLPMLARAMDAMALGEAEASHLGVNVDQVRRRTIVLVALAVGAATAMTGMVAFIGLIAPHMLRLVIGPRHRLLLPGSALLGALLIVGADLLSRTVAEPAEMPLGVVTALLGAPYFLWLLLRDKERGGFV